MRCSNRFIETKLYEVAYLRQKEETGGADDSGQLGRKIRNASAIYVGTKLAPYAPKWLPGA